MNLIPGTTVALTFVRQEGIDLTTMAILLLRSAHDTKDETMTALEDAVKKWVETTELGRSVWEQSCQDLNIGDLNGHDAFFDPDFTKILADNGLMYVDCHMADSDSAYAYDRVLAHPDDPLPELDTAPPPEPTFDTLKELARMAAEEQQSPAGQIITISHNEFDDEGNVVDSSTSDVTVEQVSDIVDHAAQLILLNREGKDIASAVGELDEALTAAGVIGAPVLDVRHRIASSTGTPPEQWQLADGPSSGVGTDYWYENTVTGATAYVCVDQGEIVTLSVKGGNDGADPGVAA